MKNIIDIHTNILYGNSTSDNPRIKELFSKIKTKSKPQIDLIKNKTLSVNKSANFDSLTKSMKKNGIGTSLCFSYQWNNHKERRHLAALGFIVPFW